LLATTVLNEHTTSNGIYTHALVFLNPVVLTAHNVV